jgi:hypothetical protein
MKKDPKLETVYSEARWNLTKSDKYVIRVIWNRYRKLYKQQRQGKLKIGEYATRRRNYLNLVYDILGMNSIQELWQISEYRVETTLDKYNIEEQLLFKEISQDELTFRDVRQRCDDLWKLIPINMELNPVRLHTLIVQKFRDDPEWYKYSKTYHIKVDEIADDDDIESYVQKVADKFKKEDGNK